MSSENARDTCQNMSETLSNSSSTTVRASRKTTSTNSTSDLVAAHRSTLKSHWPPFKKVKEHFSDHGDDRRSMSDPTPAASRFRFPPLFSVRLGKSVAWTIVSGNIIIAGMIGFWGFLWFGENANATWHYIMAGDHIKVIITGTTSIVKFPLGFMIGAECSMIVALALERGEVLFPGVASAASGRRGLGGGKWFASMKKLLYGKWPRTSWGIGLPVVLVLVTLMDIIALGIDTYLISDINLGQLATRSTTHKLNFGFQYHPDTITGSPNLRGLLYRGRTWDRKAPFYPAFAEYTENATVREGIMDTGLTLRAFLPFSNTSQRAQLHSYEGRTTVLDSRVTCQVPAFSDLAVDVQDGVAIFSGFVRATQHTPRIGNLTTVSANTINYQWHHNVTVPFVCTAPLFVGQGGDLTDQWRTGLCQLSENIHDDIGVAGGLVSEFKNYSTWAQTAYNASQNFGTAYLVFNISTGVEYVWQELYGDSRFSEHLPQYIPHHLARTFNEWLSFSLQGGLTFESTLCYSAFDTADLPVRIVTTTQRNTTEPEPQFDFSTLKYTFDDVRRQYGYGQAHNNLETSHEERGVLTLEHQSWVAAPFVQPPIEPYIRQFVSMDMQNSLGNDPWWSTFLCTASESYSGTDFLNTTWYMHNVHGEAAINILSPDPMHVWLFQEIVTNGGSVAFAIQSLITLLSSMAYYDQLGQFDNVDAVDLSSFKTTNIPTRWRGWLAVTIYLGLHLVLSWIVLIWFVKGTKYTLLGESWPGLAQAVTSETMPYLEKASEMNDDEVKKEMSKNGLSKRRVKLGPRGVHGRVAIYLVDNDDKKPDNRRLNNEQPDDAYWPHFTREGKPKGFEASFRPVDESYGQWPHFRYDGKHRDFRPSNQ